MDNRSNEVTSFNDLLRPPSLASFIQSLPTLIQTTPLRINIWKMLTATNKKAVITSKLNIEVQILHGLYLLNHLKCLSIAQLNILLIFIDNYFPKFLSKITIMKEKEIVLIMLRTMTRSSWKKNCEGEHNLSKNKKRMPFQS